MLWYAAGCCGSQVLGEIPGLWCPGFVGVCWVGAVFWRVIFSLPESTLLVEVGVVGRSAFPLVVSVVAGCCCVLALMGVVRLIGLVPSGLVLSGSSPALGFVLEGDGPLHHVLQPEGQ